MLNLSLVAKFVIVRMQEVSIYRSKPGGSFLSAAQKGGFYIGVCFLSVFTCETEAEEAMEGHREAACANKSEKYCVRKACDCVCVRLNYLA